MDALAGDVDVVVGGDGEVDELGGPGVGAVGVVGEEVSEGVDVAGEVAIIGLSTSLAHQGEADAAGVGAAGEARGGEAVGVIDGRHAGVVGGGRAPQGVGEVVAGAVEGAEFGVSRRE